MLQKLVKVVAQRDAVTRDSCAIAANAGYASPAGSTGYDSGADASAALLETPACKHQPVSGDVEAATRKARTQCMWNQALHAAAILGKGLQHAKTESLILEAEHWLEATEAKHRYGSNLRPYFDYWLTLQGESSTPRSPSAKSPVAHPAPDSASDGAEGCSVPALSTATAAASSAPGSDSSRTPFAGAAAESEPGSVFTGEESGAAGGLAVVEPIATVTGQRPGKMGVQPLLSTYRLHERFFKWLDEGAGRFIDLADKGCPRAKLESQKVKYLTPEERVHYEIVVDPATGLFRYRLSGELVHTTDLYNGDTRVPNLQPPSPAARSSARALVNRASSTSNGGPNSAFALAAAATAAAAPIVAALAEAGGVGAPRTGDPEATRETATQLLKAAAVAAAEEARICSDSEVAADAPPRAYSTERAMTDFLNALEPGSSGVDAAASVQDHSTKHTSEVQIAAAVAADAATAALGGCASPSGPGPCVADASSTDTRASSVSLVTVAEGPGSAGTPSSVAEIDSIASAPATMEAAAAAAAGLKREAGAVVQGLQASSMLASHDTPTPFLIQEEFCANGTSRQQGMRTSSSLPALHVGEADLLPKFRHANSPGPGCDSSSPAFRSHPARGLSSSPTGRGAHGNSPSASSSARNSPFAAAGMLHPTDSASHSCAYGKSAAVVSDDGNDDDLFEQQGEVQEGMGQDAVLKSGLQSGVPASGGRPRRWSVALEHANSVVVGAPRKWIYVVDTEQRLYVHYKHKGRFHHSSFLRGAPVLAAGNLIIEGGLLKKLTPDSGHYRPLTENFKWLVEHLKLLGANLDHAQLTAKHVPI